MQIKLKELTFLPFVSLFSTILMISVSFVDLEMQLISYATLACVLACFTCMLVMYLYEAEMSRFGFFNLLFMGVFIASTLINANDMKNSIYMAIETWLFLLVMHYYKDRMKMIIICSTIAFSLCIYWNAFHMAMNPQLWIVDAEKSSRGYLLGGNYNGMGIRMIVALTTNLICLKFSKWWLLNIIPLTIAIIVPLAIVQSMTSLASIILLLVLCIIPSYKVKKTAFWGLFTFFMLFQIFIVFSGKGLENNELAVYIIEDVLGKDITFTNRTHMWDSALALIAKSPIIGHGYATVDWFRSNMTNFAVGPHNHILSILLFGGIILLGLYIAICTLAYKSISKCNDSMSVIILLANVTMLIMMLMEMYPYTFVFYLMAITYYYPYLEKETITDKIT